jgi:hypothetical protein
MRDPRSIATGAFLACFVALTAPAYAQSNLFVERGREFIIPPTNDLFCSKNGSESGSLQSNESEFTWVTHSSGGVLLKSARAEDPEQGKILFMTVEGKGFDISDVEQDIDKLLSMSEEEIVKTADPLRSDQAALLLQALAKGVKNCRYLRELYKRGVPGITVRTPRLGPTPGSGGI